MQLHRLTVKNLSISMNLESTTEWRKSIKPVVSNHKEMAEKKSTPCV